jgi:hypothetical protein
MGNIFLSYRRHDSSTWARPLRDRLARRFGGAHVFFDIDETIAEGDNYARLIEERISSCDVLLALIGPSWNPPTANDGPARLSSDHDMVRFEVRTALGSAVTVVPVLVGGASMPAPDDLPEDLRPLTRLQAVSLDPEGFDDGTARLLSTVDGMLSLSLAADAGSAAGGSSILRLDLLDVEGHRIAEPAAVTLRSQHAAHVVRFSEVDARRRLTVRGLGDAPAQHYVLDVTAPSFRSVRWVVEAKPWKAGSSVAVMLPLDPAHNTALRLPGFAQLPASVRPIFANTKSAAMQYDTLPPAARANALNLFASAACMLLSNGQTLTDALASATPGTVLRSVRSDSMLLSVGVDLVTRIRESVDAGMLDTVPGALHTPPAGYLLAFSAKAPDQFLALQATVFQKQRQWLLELDLDEIGGLSCIFRVQRNGGPIGFHPCDIHQLLRGYRHIDPGYRWERASPPQPDVV